MFLLLLMGLGAAGVKAQVRIGGNSAPNAAAVLDLNTNDDATPTGNKGLALPRVNLTSATMQLTTGVANLTGMMVYNSSTTGTGVNRIGIYFWNGANWVLASLPSTSAADSGKILLSDGTSWIPTLPGETSYILNKDSIHNALSPVTITWQKTLDTTLTITLMEGRWTNIWANGVHAGDLCLETGVSRLPVFWTDNGWVTVGTLQAIAEVSAPMHIRCYRPSA